MRDFQLEIRERAEKVERYLLLPEFAPALPAGQLRDAVLAYPSLRKKMLRPVVVMLSCGAVGSDEDAALPVAAAVEIFHTWTLVHDDIIDHDIKRRGANTVHEEFRRRALIELKLPEPKALEYGTAIAILAGDFQHGWAVRLLCQSSRNGVAPDVALALVSLLEEDVLGELILGQVQDVLLSKRPLKEVTKEQVYEVMRRKTGKLYSFAARAGAIVGLNALDDEKGWIKALGDFLERCAVAFQIQDDVLSIIGDEALLGKAVGSDIREGKKTLPLLLALERASSTEQRLLERVVGNDSATSADIQGALSIIQGLGGVESARRIAYEIFENARSGFENTALPSRHHQKLLIECGRFMVERTQ